MKINPASITLFTLGLILAGAVGTSAFMTTTDSPTTNNTNPPINISNLDQVKNGGLSVNTFQARGNALFMQNAIFKGAMHGGLPTDTTSTLKVDTDTTVTGTLRAKEYLNAKSIAHVGDSSEKPLCANDLGVIVTCESLVSTGGGGGTGVTSNPPTVASSDAQTWYANGIATDPDAVRCSVTLSSPADAGGATVDVQYRYQDDTGMTIMGICPTINVPAGANGGSSVNPEQFNGARPLLRSCVLDASIPVDPSIHC